MKTRSQLFTLFLLVVLSAQKSRAQSYGLGFYSHEVVQDQRTGLDLSPTETLCFNSNFEISFEIGFLPARKDYFGYILRLVKNDSQNIDLIYDKDAREKNHFKVIIGDRFSNIAFNIPPEQLFSHWNKIKLRFNFDKQLLELSYGHFSAQAPLKLDKSDCFKVLFGANEYLDFKTTDVPPMKISNVIVKVNEQQKFFWPLDDYKGNTAKEEVSGKSAAVVKPLWIKKMHYNWQLMKTMVVDGPVSVAFDSSRAAVRIIGIDSLISYSVKDNQISYSAYASGKQYLLRGNQSIVDNNGVLHNFYMDDQILSTYDPVTGRWTKNYDPKRNITDFWQYNKFYNPLDSSIYMIGGYGHFFYKNQVQRYHLPSGKWDTLKVGGDTLTPRYLAALGRSGNGAYILGGYGSTTGQQMLNPRNLYDLIYFDAKKKTFKKRYELKIKGEDFVFANSLIINEKEQKYYALVFPKHKFNSSLQLIAGSLTKPEFKLQGSPIPYLFHDIKAYADLFYIPESKRFIAVSLFWDDNNKTKVNIYSLYGPPLEQLEAEAANENPLFWIGAFILIVVASLGGGVLMYRASKKRKPEEVTLTTPGELPLVPVAPAADSHTITSNAIFLFGDMQVFDQSGADITRQFTPLIKELFLVILLYSVRLERGISSEKLKELLWFDKTEESARNNRSVNMAKLKGILEKLDTCSISKETGYWKMNADFSRLYMDFHAYTGMIKSKTMPGKEKLQELGKVISRGAFLPNVNYEWLDAFKSELSAEIIDAYLNYAGSVKLADEPEFLIELAGYVFHFDPVNEEAMTLKCRCLVHLGKHSQAKNTYENFCKEYKLLYNDAYGKRFNEVLNDNSIN